MSKLDDLIRELCPDGVEFRKVGDIANISRGKVMSKDFLKENAGEYPVYSSQTENEGKLGSITTYMFDGEYLTWTTDGANAGTVFYRSGKFSVTNVCGVIDNISEDVNTKYLYYVLNRVAPTYVNSGMGNPKLMSNVMARISLPIPPLEIQREIVRILDNFTELTAELTARKAQYSYYRDKLLQYETIIEELEIGEVCNLSAGGDVPKDRFSKEKTERYKIPIISNGSGINALYGYTDIPKVVEPSVTVAARGTIGYAEYRDYPYFPIIRLITLIPKDIKRLNTKYLYYCLQGRKYKIPMSGIPQLTVPMLKKQKVSIPPLDVQNRIVNVLDNFEKICSDLNIGLPAEIEARKKQYEYYRDKLLSFKEHEDGLSN